MSRLLRVGLLGLAWLSVGAALVGFVLPWAMLEVEYVQGTALEELAGKLGQELGRVVVSVKRGAETVTGELPDLSQIADEVSGIQIPQLANRKDAKVVLALAEMLTGPHTKIFGVGAGQRELGAKSYAVYLVPGLALLCGLLLTGAGRARAVCLLLAFLCFGIAGAGFWKLLTTKTDTLLVGIVIGQGLWMSLWAYVGLGVAAMGLAASSPATR